VTVAYASIGNSDDALSQVRWHQYVAAFQQIMSAHSRNVYGHWLSEPSSPYQNACSAVEVWPNDSVLSDLKQELTALRHRFEQDSIALVVASETEFV
jgi:hypothetical protein